MRMLAALLLVCASMTLLIQGTVAARSRDPCEGFRCQTGQECRLKQSDNSTVCVWLDESQFNNANFQKCSSAPRCPRNSECKLQKVTCIRSPCNPVPTCVLIVSRQTSLQGTSQGTTTQASRRPTPSTPFQESQGPCAEVTRGQGRALLGRFIPRCTPDGYYEPKQCHSASGYCWCVDRETGIETPGTRVKAPARPDCHRSLSRPSGNRPSGSRPSGSDQKPCHRARQEAGPPAPGQFLPECTRDGYYQSKQCHSSTGYCWCVRKTGEEIQGTRQNVRFGGRDQVQCDQSSQGAGMRPGSAHPPARPGSPYPAQRPATRPCRAEQEAAGRPMYGKFIPECTRDGYWETRQCDRFEGYCWCVRRQTGEMVEDTKERIRSYTDDDLLPQCDHYEEELRGGGLHFARMGGGNLECYECEGSTEYSDHDSCLNPTHYTPTKKCTNCWTHITKYHENRYYVHIARGCAETCDRSNNDMEDQWCCGKSKCNSQTEDFFNGAMANSYVSVVSMVGALVLALLYQ